MNDLRGLFSFVNEALLTLWSHQLLVLHLVAALSIPSVLLRRSGQPTAALSWLLAFFALPGLGVLAWWGFGRTHMDRKLRSQEVRRKGFGARRKRSAHDALPATVAGETFPGWLPARAFENHANVSVNNQVRLLSNGKEAFARIEQAIDGAKRSVHLLFYIFELDETGNRLCDLLIEKAKAGLTVRILVDGFGSSKSIPRMKKRLKACGVEVGVFLPSRLSPLYSPRFNFINHRKIITIDEELAFCGGMNVADDYRTTWHDLMLEMSGSAVQGLSRIFLEDWYFATGQLVDDPAPPLKHKFQNDVEIAVVASGPDTEPWVHDAYFTAITRAKNRLYIATPYFIPTPSILTALRTARGRGVDVRLLLPSRGDVELVKWASRSFYLSLVQVGVRIFEYDVVMLHAKAMLLDDQIVSIGTANVDNRSFRLNFEVNCFVRDETLAGELASWMEAHMNDSQEISADFLREKGLPRRLLESTAHLMSPLL